MNSWDKNRKDLIYKQKLQKVKSTMHKIFTSPQTINNLIVRKKSPQRKKEMNTITNNFQVEYNKEENYQKQQCLKKMLKEFGLQQYLRKFYELGYDDNSIHKLAVITHKELDQFLMNLRIFPGHRVKVVAFLENIKRLCGNPNRLERNPQSVRIKKNSETASNFNNRRFHSTNTNRNGNKNMHTVYGNINYAKKPKSVEAMRTNNRMIKSFAKGNGFGFNYYLDENSERRNIQSGKSDGSEIKSFKEEQIGNINGEIDKLLNYYMAELNEKLDDSLDSLDHEDSSLSNLASIQNILNKEIKIDRENILKVENISEIRAKNIETPPHSENNKSSTINQILEKNSTQDLNSNMTNVKNDVTKENSKILSKQDKLEEEFYNDYDNFDIGIEEHLVGEGEGEKDLVIRISPKETPKENYKQTPRKSLNDIPQDKDTSVINNNMITPKADNSQIPIARPLPTEPEAEDSISDDVRLVKSCEEAYLRQNIDYFDVEYMCRCLGLALMKHLESGQDKQHIMELMNFKENFSFYNSIFNVNLEFFNTFFNMENQDKISNLDKLDLKSIEETENLLNGVDHKVNIEEKKNQPISYVSHMKKDSKKEINESSIDHIEHEEGTKKIFSQYEIEKDMNLINDFFKINASKLNNSRYKNMNENTKHILCQDLNSIHEIDSVEYCSNNQLFTVEQKKDKTDYIDLLRQSAVDFVGGENAENVENTENVENVEKESPEEKEDDIENNNIHTDNIIKEANESYEEDFNEAKNETKFNSYNLNNEDKEENVDDYYYTETPLHQKITEDIVSTEKDDAQFESGVMESNYIIDVTNAEKLKNYLLKTSEIYDDDYEYSSSKILQKRFAPPPDPQQIFEFCANIIIMTKMEKEVIMICLIYIERLIFNTGLLLNSRNWKRLMFTALAIASKIWDDDSFENNHFAQVFTHLKIGEINMLERTFLELINYKVYVKCSEYFKYFFIIKSIALKYNFNGLKMVPISVEKMMKLQESAYQAQKKLRKKYSYNNSAQF